MMGVTAWSGSAAAGLLWCLLLAGTRVPTGSAGSIRLTECPADAPEATFSWENDGDYLYVEGDGSCVTLPDIYNGVDNPPLTYHTVDGDESDTETG
ncbi:unnamed protein product [Ectocarpus sp. CCAP 1310/34]|nr:unnamed protein product [Ectocarpus sp. CCAP 1310/34]